MIYQRAGISLHTGKQAMVYSRLSRRLRETSHRSFASYLEWLEQSSGPAGEQEWQEFINCLTTNLTSFFREEHHFHALADELKARAGRPLRIWCNAASTGEEPYTLAMTAVEALGEGEAPLPRHGDVAHAVQQPYRAFERDRLAHDEMALAVLEQPEPIVVTGWIVFGRQGDRAALAQFLLLRQAEPRPYEILGEIGRRGDTDESANAFGSGKCH